MGLRRVVTHLQLSKLLDGLLAPFDGRVGLKLQVLQVALQLLLGRRRQGTLLPLVFQFRLILVKLSEKQRCVLPGCPGR